MVSASPYRKIFNLFAFAVLAFAIYINFCRPDDAIWQPKNAVNTQLVNSTAQAKPLATAENNKTKQGKVN
jgi:hypothetical protein